MLHRHRRRADHAEPHHRRDQPAAALQIDQRQPWNLEGGAKGKIVIAKGDTLVDNDFAVPGASGCGGSTAALIDPIVDLDVGIPSAAGANTAIMKGTLQETTAAYALKYKPKHKKK